MHSDKLELNFEIHIFDVSDSIAMGYNDKYLQTKPLNLSKYQFLR